MNRVRHALAADLEQIATVQAASFYDDPQMSFLFPDPATRLEDITTMFRVIGAAGLRRGHTYVLDSSQGERSPGRLDAAAVWSPPGIEALSDEEAAPIVDLITSRYGEAGLTRIAAMSEAMQANHPSDPHHYLFIVGVDPDLQGRGLGARLIAPSLDHCDAVGSAAYLESSNARNIGFYERLGFHTVSEFHPDGGPLFTGMWRQPAD